MASVKTVIGETSSSFGHMERTADDPRHQRLHRVILREVKTVNESVRLLRFQVPDGDLMFLPGQWLDVHIPGISNPGGFTITSTPRDALQPQPQLEEENDDANSHPLPYPFIELAIQRSPQNPAAAWFWQAKARILDSELQVRVGGRFVWPPPKLQPDSITKLVFIAGGVGINPLISILSHLSATKTTPPTIHFLYSSKTPRASKSTSFSSTINVEEEEEEEEEEEKILFLARLKSLLSSTDTTTSGVNTRLDLFLTCNNNNNNNNNALLPSSQSMMEKQDRGRGRGRGNNMMTYQIHHRRIGLDDLIDAVRLPEPGSTEESERHDGTVCYVCGPPRMTDWLVGFLSDDLGLGEDRVLCERWW